jgi:UDP-glucose:tetrahydrobiopterin glucosyltransferase
VRIAIVSTPVGPLGSGIGGGVELTLHGLVMGLTARGHVVDVVAPAGSISVAPRLHEIPGALQPSTQNQPRTDPTPIAADSVIGAMWEFIRVNQSDYDVVLNMAYDWLPFYLTAFLDTPVAHIVSMASLTDAMDAAISGALLARPGSCAVHSRAQAETFGAFADRFHVIGNGVDVERYVFRPEPDPPGHLGFVGRVSREKGIADVFATAAATRQPVRAWGLMQDPQCWADAVAGHPHAHVTYEGFLPTDQLQEAIGGCRALLMTPRWVEAFGNVAVEALACGVPVIAYDRGGPAEIVTDGVTGFLVQPGDIAGLAAAVARIDELDRAACRRTVEERFSIDALATRVEAWLETLLATGPR